MIEFIEETKNFINRTGLLTVLLFIAGIALFNFLGAYFPSLHFIGVAVLLFSLSLGAFYLTDRFCFPNLDFFDEIKNGNVAASIALLAVFVLIGIAELCAFSVFFTLR